MDDDYDDDDRPRRPVPGRIHCPFCSAVFTWAEQRANFGRLIHVGVSKEDAKRLMPRCRRCTNKIVKAAKYNLYLQGAFDHWGVSDFQQLPDYTQKYLAKIKPKP